MAGGQRLIKPSFTLLALFLLAGVVLLRPQATHRRSTGPVVSSPREIAEAIQKLEGELRVATMKGDASWFEQHLGDSYTETDAQGKFITRAELIQFYRTTQPEYDAWNLSDGTARTFNGDTVVLTGRIEVQASGKAQIATGVYRFTRVWIKQGLEWKLAASQLTRAEK